MHMYVRLQPRHCASCTVYRVRCDQMEADLAQRLVSDQRRCTRRVETFRRALLERRERVREGGCTSHSSGAKRDLEQLARY